MKAKELYTTLKLQAKQIEDVDHTVLYVSDTVSKYIRNKVREMTRKEIHEILLDWELGIIDKQTANKEIDVQKLICKSL